MAVELDLGVLRIGVMQLHASTSPSVGRSGGILKDCSKARPSVSAPADLA